MLLRNESSVRHSIHIKLVFDDGSKRELYIHEGDLVEVKYRHNCSCVLGKGIIRKIEPYVTYPYCNDSNVVNYMPYSRCAVNHIKESAIIYVDMSMDHNCCMKKIDLKDIVDIKLLYDCNCPVEKPEPPCCHKPHHPKPECPTVQYSCFVGSPLTNKGVLGHD